MTNKDFGVSFWSAHKNIVEAPEFYVGGKDVYSVDEGQSVKSQFDIKYTE